MTKTNLTDGRLTDDQIVEYIKFFSSTYFAENEKYYKGENPTITNRDSPDNTGESPNNKVPVSYARKIINTVVGYMYKPGLIFYNSEKDKALDELHKIFNLNNEPLKSAQIGKQASLYGAGYELHYTDEKSQSRFCKINEREIIPLYDYSIEPQLIAAIRFYNVKESDGEVTKIHVYYPDTIHNCQMTKGGGGFKHIDETAHYYKQIPLVVYRNNEDEIGDFDTVKKLIDAYDVLMSDSLNEFDRFAWAYLILKGLTLETDDEAENIKLKKIFEVPIEGAVDFLTKDIPHDFIQFMSELIRKEIHKQTHVPDFLDNAQTGDSLSGVAISKLLYDFEFIAATKEAYFKEGLQKRIELINAVLGIKSGKDAASGDVQIIMNRNIPQNDKENAEIYGMLDGKGFSRETLMGRFANFVESPADELKKFEEEQGDSIDLDEPPVEKFGSQEEPVVEPE